MTLDTLFIFDQDSDSEDVYSAALESTTEALGDHCFSREEITEVKRIRDIPKEWIDGRPYRQNEDKGPLLSTIDLLEKLNEEQEKQNDPDYIQYLKLKKKFEK